MSAPVAVIIPAHQAVDHIDATLASIAGQTLRPSEVVLVDDGSSDGTALAASKWHDVLPLNILSHDRPLGPAAARRTAIDASNSTLIALLDADDLWLPNHLEFLANQYDIHGGLITADAYRWDPTQGVMRTTHRKLNSVPPIPKQPKEILRRNFVFVGSLFSRYTYDDVGGFRDNFTGSEDWDLWIRMVRDGIAVHPVKPPTVLYRLSPTSVTNRPDVMDAYVSVLERALVEARDDEEVDAVRSSLAWMHSRRQLHHIQLAAREGNTSRVRNGTLPNQVRMRAEALALRACPRLSSSVGRTARRRYWS